jgi:hypothetical protein
VQYCSIVDPSLPFGFTVTDLPIFNRKPFFFCVVLCAAAEKKKEEKKTCSLLTPVLACDVALGCGNVDRAGRDACG